MAVALLLLAGIRLALGAAGLAASMLRGVAPAVASLTFAVGVVVLGFSIVATRRGMWSGSDEPVERPVRAALASTYPSTIGLTALIVLSLVLDPQLAALLAGLLAGLGLAALIVAAQIGWARRLGAAGDD